MEEFSKFMNVPTGEELEYGNGQMIRRVGEKLKMLRYNAHYSVPEACELLKKLYDMDVSVSTMNSYENDRRIPNVQVFFALCDLYKCNNILEYFSVEGKDRTASVLILGNTTVDQLVRILYEHYGKEQYVEMMQKMIAHLAEENYYSFM